MHARQFGYALRPGAGMRLLLPRLGACGWRVLVATAALGLVGVSAAQASDAIVVGRTLPLSGPLKGYGEAKRDGGDAYIRKVNAAGGVGGHTIELLTLDDAYNPVTTVAAALPVLNELKVPAVGLTSGAAVVRAPFNRYAFPVRASYASEAHKLVTHVKTVNITKVAVVYTDNPFGVSVKDTLLAALKEGGLEAKTFKIDPAGNSASAAAAQVRAEGPQAVFLTMLSQGAIPMLTELKNSTFRGALYTFSPVDTSAVTKQLGAEASGLAITQIVPIPSGIRFRVVAEYLQALKDLGHGAPSFYGLEAYLEAKVLVEGLRRAGPGVTPQSLVKGLETLNDLDLGDFFVSYRPDAHSGSNFVEIDVINSSGAVMR